MRDEIASRLSGVRRLRPVPGRVDSFECDYSGPLRAVLGLRTVVAPFLVLSFDVPRPQALLSGEFMPTMLAAVRSVRELNQKAPPTSLRIEAAGRDSSVMRKLADQLASGGGMRHDPQDGECVIRLRRSADGTGWDVLVRLSTMPLSRRPWRVAGHPAAANATVAAAMAILSAPASGQRVVNLMCGSGTLIIERMVAAKAGQAYGFDVDTSAVAAARRNARAAGLGDQIEFALADVMDDAWMARGPFDVLMADPPWGDKSGWHDDNERLHLALLRRAHEAAAPGARLVVLTHEVRIMTRCLAQLRGMWSPLSETRVFQKGHHPRIYVCTANPV